MRIVMKVTFASMAYFLLVFAQNVSAGGLLGDIVEGVGRATGIKPIEDLGRNADEEYRRIKESNPDYKRIEEGATNMVRRPFAIACTIPYQTITNVVISQCSNWDGRLDDQHLIEQAKNILVSNGIFPQSEFNGIQIRWCPLSGAHGMAPDRGRIYLDASQKEAVSEDIAVLLAHEMVHVIQYRRMGTDNFKCEYSRKYAECGGCQDSRHSLEAEAYSFQHDVAKRLSENNQVQYQQANDAQNTYAGAQQEGVRPGLQYPQPLPTIATPLYCCNPANSMKVCQIAQVTGGTGIACQCLGVFGTGYTCY